MPVPNTKGKFCTSVQDMEIGDYIACKYTASSGVAGEFSDLGAALSVAQANEIPVVSSATPNGYFYFIKADTGILIADRNVQHSISWATLNIKGYIEGCGYYNKTNFKEIITSSGEYGSSYKKENIADGNFSTNWCASGYNGDGKTDVLSLNIGYNFGSIKSIKGFSYSSGTGNSASAGHIASKIKLQISMDNETFVDYGIFTVPKTTTANTFFFFDKHIDCMAVRILPAVNNLAGAHGWYVGELHFYNGIVLVRSIDGGVSYIDANGNRSLTYTELGAFPGNNEWDQYIEKSNLNGKIIAGDENVWNHLRNVDSNTGLYSFVKNKREANAIARVQATQLSVNYNKAKIVDSSDPSAKTIIRGFRPVLQLLHPKQTNFYY